MKNKFLTGTNRKIFCISVAIMVCLAVFIVCTKIVPQMSIFSKSFVINDQKGSVIVLKDGSEAVQTFEIPVEQFSGLKLYFGDTDYPEDGTAGKVKVQLLDEEEEEVYSWEIRRALLAVEGWQEFQADSLLPVEKGDKYSVRVSLTDGAGSTVRLRCSKVDALPDDTMRLNGEKETGDIVLAICGRDAGAGQNVIFYLIYLVLSLLFLAGVYSICCGKLPQQMDTVEILDLVFVLAAALGCVFLISQGGDLSVTIHHSEDLISSIRQGKFFDFYELVLNKALDGGYDGVASIAYSAAYNIFMYLILAVIISPWVLVSKVFSLQYQTQDILLYVQMVVLLLDIGAAWLLEKVCREFGWEEKQAKLTGFLFLSSTITLFGTAGFGQLDIIYVLLMIWALLFFARKQYYRFSMVMSVAVMLKPFPLLVFVPLILLTHKKVWQIVSHLLVGMGASLLFMLMFGSNPGYTATQESLNRMFGFLDRVFAFRVDTPFLPSAVFIVLYVLVCVWAYSQSGETDKKRYEQMVFLGLCVYGGFFTCILWHPQWLTIFSVFVAMAIPAAGKRGRTLLYCDFGIQLAYLMSASMKFEKAADNYMVNRGILPRLTGHGYKGITFAEMAGNVTEYMDVFGFSVLTGLMIAFAVLYYQQVREKETGGYVCDRIIVWARTGILLLWILMYCVFFFYIG